MAIKETREHIYDKTSWRIENVRFIKKIFQSSFKSRSCAEMIGNHNPGDKKNANETYSLMVKAGLISRPDQFIGVDWNPLVLLRRSYEKADYQPYPLVFGDMLDACLRVQKSKGILIGLEKNQVTVTPNLCVLNLDTEKSIRNESDDNKTEWWANNGTKLAKFVSNAFEYTDKVSLILNFVRDRGTNSRGIDNRQRIFYDYIISYLGHGKSFESFENASKNFQTYSSDKLEKNERSRGVVMLTARVLISPRDISFHGFG